MAGKFDGDFIVGVAEEFHWSSLAGIPARRIDRLTIPCTIQIIYARQRHANIERKQLTPETLMLPKYSPHPDHEARIRSALTAIKAILPLNLYPAHKKELLSVCIWKITEADGKDRVRYWSEGSLEADKKDLRHEHVYERKELILRLLDGESIDSVASNAIACMVTKEEHNVLGLQAESGWSRYTGARIRVYDSLEGIWIP